jgi:integrase
LAGLRTGEVFALRREKDKDSRVVPILSGLFPVLAAWKLKQGGEGRIVPPLCSDGKEIDEQTPGKYLRDALKKLGLTRRGLGWYEATRHTFASQWVLSGGSIEKLSKMLGHYSVVVTERYVHLRPDLFAQRDLDTIPLDLGAGSEVPVQIGQSLGSDANEKLRNQS